MAAVRFCVKRSYDAQVLGSGVILIEYRRVNKGLRINAHACRALVDAFNRCARGKESVK